MNAREAILRSVRAELARSARASVSPAARGHEEGSAIAVTPPPPVPMLGRVDLAIAERVERFTAALEAVGGHCHVGEPAGTVAEVLARYGPHSIAASDADIVAALRDHPTFAGFRWLPSDCTQDELFAADVGITAAQWAIADTGTIVLESADERSRLASLVPPVHIALVPVSRMLCDLGELLKTLGRPLSTAVTLITGPSRTADIELQLVLGVHGPRELHVVLT